MPEEQSPVLTASVHDLRYIATILRGINFHNRATVTVTKQGLTVKVEEARTITATAWIFSDIFDEYTYNPDSLPNDVFIQSTQDEDMNSVMFEMPLNTVIDCLNIFGTATSSVGSGGSGGGKRWKKQGEATDNESGDENEIHPGGNRIEPLNAGTSEKHTGMRLTYTGAGYPLTLLIAEDASGPTTTCEISTYEPESYLDFGFDNERMVLKIILKSSWLRDALSELDPSYDKLTFISNPPEMTDNPDTGGQRRRRNLTKSILRIKAGGNFGTTEMDYPNDKEVLESFECTRSVSFSYRFSHIAKTLRAVSSSTKTSLRIDDDGLLSLQFMMPSPKARGTDGGDSSAFIDFQVMYSSSPSMIFSPLI
ncbi:Cell cycle checkpoint protein RAD1 [Leucoagaricus sp. SymC.cos]|nr:Cell cycle checkpoint protein RAD1 [Leucoagaricus sp. SymC.cos]KXN93320.1 Cell cycle checkpoint protein RAD1 [Leucoagaricus sp. SymC.cos]